MNVGDKNESEGHSLSELDSEIGKVTREALISVDKAPLSLPARSGIDPRQSRQQWLALLEQDPRLVGQPAERRGARQIENETLVRLNRSLHAAWRDAVRTPWRNCGAACATRCLCPAKARQSLSTMRQI